VSLDACRAAGNAVLRARTTAEVQQIADCLVADRAGLRETDIR
jgi:hypothetical protein